MTLRALADVRKLLGHRPADRRKLFHVAAYGCPTGRGGGGPDKAEFAVLLGLVLALEGVSFGRKLGATVGVRFAPKADTDCGSSDVRHSGKIAPSRRD
jgi:hypothetical protein